MRTVGENILVLSFALFSSAFAQECSAPLEYPTITLEDKYTSQQSFNSGDKVYYKCSEDYIQSGGKRSSVCQDGTWTELTLMCEVRTCGNAGDLPNGNFIYEGDNYINETVRAKCKEGYVLKGMGFMICKRSGWTGEFPSCVEEGSVPSVVEKICPTPHVENSLQKGGDGEVYRVGYSLRFACKEGFQLEGAQQITCGQDGQWQSPFPRCLPSPDKPVQPSSKEGDGCGAPEAVEGSHTNLISKYAAKTAFSSGDKVYYTCDVGYASARGNRGRRCVDGKWSRLKLRCERVLCGHAGEIQNGMFIYTGVEFGDTATAVCNDGFQMVGKATRHCMAQGWDGRAPVCEAVSCPEPKVTNAVNKDVKEPPYTYRTAIRYECRTGTLVGQNEIWCTKNGTWSSSPPDCREIGCPSPNVRNAFWMGAHKKMHEPMETIMIECIRGYSIRGPNTIFCSREGKWLPGLPQCVSRYGRYG